MWFVFSSACLAPVASSRRPPRWRCVPLHLADGRLHRASRLAECRRLPSFRRSRLSIPQCTLVIIEPKRLDNKRTYTRTYAPPSGCSTALKSCRDTHANVCKFVVEMCSYKDWKLPECFIITPSNFATFFDNFTIAAKLILCCINKDREPQSFTPN